MAKSLEFFGALGNIEHGTEKNTVCSGKVETGSRISTPWKIKPKDARQFISIINDELLRVCARIEEDGFYFEGCKGMDEVLTYEVYQKLLKWSHRSGIKNEGWRKKNRRRN